MASKNFLVDGTGHVKLTDFGLATGALNPQRIESLKGGVSSFAFITVSERLTVPSARQSQRQRSRPPFHAREEVHLPIHP